MGTCDEAPRIREGADTAIVGQVGVRPDPEFAWAAPMGGWRAANEQALSITGNLRIGPPDAATHEVSLAFTHGVTLLIKPAPLPLDEPAIRARLAQARRLMDAPASVFPIHFAVVRESVATSAPYAGLCGGLRTRTLALAEFANERGERVLRIVSFHGPPPTADRKAAESTELAPCFAFDFEQSSLAQ